MAAQYTNHSYPVTVRTNATFVISESSFPAGWTLVPGPKDNLRCPRCNGAK